MNREEITNSQNYKATRAAMEYWYSLPEEYKARINNLGPEPDVIDAYEEGVIYGWNNPNWISVEDELPKENEKVLAYNSLFSEKYLCVYHNGKFEDYLGELGKGAVSHWMLIVPPRKED